MAFEPVQFTDRSGRPVPEELRKQLLQAVTAVIAHPDADVDAVLKRAQTIALRAADGEIGDVCHYATKALFALSREGALKREQEPVSPQPPEIMQFLAGTANEASEAAIEARILIEELLPRLLPKEREVYIRHTEGFEHVEIARELGISVATSWFRFVRAKKKLAAWLRSAR